MAILILYVDDILIASNCRRKLSEIKSHLNTAFEMQYLGEPKRFLGINIQRNSDSIITLNQPEYTEKFQKDLTWWKVNLRVHQW